MDMSLANCWDCPVTLASVVGYQIAIAAAIAVGLWLFTSRKPVLRGLGMILVVLSIVLALAFTSAVPRWGIVNPFASRYEVFSRTVTRSIYFGYDALLILALVLVTRARRVSSRAD